MPDSAPGFRPAGTAAASGCGPVTFLLLGASNLARSWRALAGCLRANLSPDSVEFLAACGPGRGYVAPGGLLNITYPPIQTCGIFDAAQKASVWGHRVVALLTDIGNDLLYDVRGEELVRGVDSVIGRLRQLNARVLITPVHPALEQKLTPRRFIFLRTWLYPKSRTPYAQVIDGLRQVNRFLVARQETGEVSLIRGMEAYQGWDQVHYGFFRARGAWTLAAENMLQALATSLHRPVTLAGLMAAYLDYARHLVITDMLSLASGGRGVY
ncbi:MAG: hypothetical protein ACE5ER_01450 [Nitrospinaceae bacterium]